MNFKDTDALSDYLEGLRHKVFMSDAKDILVKMIGLSIKGEIVAASEYNRMMVSRHHYSQYNVYTKLRDDLDLLKSREDDPVVSLFIREHKARLETLRVALAEQNLAIAISRFAIDSRNMKGENNIQPSSPLDLQKEVIENLYGDIIKRRTLTNITDLLGADLEG